MEKADTRQPRSRSINLRRRRGRGWWMPVSKVTLSRYPLHLRSTREKIMRPPWSVGWALDTGTIDETAMKANKIAPDGWRAGRAVINRQVDRLIGFTRSCSPHSVNARSAFCFYARPHARVQHALSVSLDNWVRPELAWPGDVRPICSNSIGADGD